MFDFETKLRHWASLRPTRPGAAGKRSKRQRTTAFEFLEERCCPSTLDLWTGGGGTNLYSNAANWSLGVVPNNGNSYQGSPTNFDVEIPASSAVTQDISATIDNLTLDAATSSLSISGGQSLAVAGSGSTTGTIANNGTISVGSSSGASTLFADLNAGTINLSGGGTINLNNPNSYLRGYNGNETLVNQGNLIQGQGYIYGLNSFQNQATVDANVSGGTLEIYDITTAATNTGTLEATSGGTLDINGITVNDQGYTISTDSTSKLIIQSSTINGGSLTAASPAVVEAQNNTLNGVTITSGTTYSIDPGYNTYLISDLSTRERSTSGPAAALHPLCRGNHGERRHDQSLRRRHHQPQQPQLLSPWL